MFNYSTQKSTKSTLQDAIRFDRPPLESEAIFSLRNDIRATYYSYLNAVLAFFVLAIGLSTRAITLQIENADRLLELGLYVGFWIGLFAGVSISGSSRDRVRMATVGVLVCCSASVSSSMLITLLTGYTVSWISSVNILASALAGMWLLTYYDGVVKTMAMTKDVNAKELHFIIRAAELFESIHLYGNKIKEKNRKPILAEYWVIRNWIRSRGEQ